MHKVRTLRLREGTELVDFIFLNAFSARLWDAPKSANDVRVVLLDVSSFAALTRCLDDIRSRQFRICKHQLVST